MKRRLLIVAVFLLAGAVVNVAVAWIVVVSRSYPYWPPSADIFQDRKWPRPVPDDWPERADLIEGQIIGWTLRHYQAMGLEQRTDDELWMTEQFLMNIDSVGLPLRALQWEIWVDYVHPVEPAKAGTYRVKGLRQPSLWASGIPLPFGSHGFSLDSYRRLPIRPVWSGFAINTLFYAAFLWLLSPGPFALRRFIRRRRGLCVRCAYPMGESDVCSECGMELTKPRLDIGEHHET